MMRSSVSKLFQLLAIISSLSSVELKSINNNELTDKESKLQSGVNLRRRHDDVVRNTHVGNGIYNRELKKDKEDKEDKEDTDGIEDRQFNPEFQPEEAVDCIEFNDTRVQDKLKEWPGLNYSDPVCFTNSCNKGCCRNYNWLLCDESNELPYIACVCNQNTRANNRVPTLPPAVASGENAGATYWTFTPPDDISPFVVGSPNDDNSDSAVPPADSTDFAVTPTDVVPTNDSVNEQDGELQGLVGTETTEDWTVDIVATNEQEAAVNIPNDFPSPNNNDIPPPFLTPVQASAFCSNNSKCHAAGISGICCPTITGILLSCCDGYVDESSSTIIMSNSTGSSATIDTDDTDGNVDINLDITDTESENGDFNNIQINYDEIDRTGIANPTTGSGNAANAINPLFDPSKFSYSDEYGPDACENGSSFGSFGINSDSCKRQGDCENPDYCCTAFFCICAKAAPGDKVCLKPY